MLRILTLSVTIFFVQFAFSQSYWQQEVNYTISVKLNDREHTLSAYEEFEYINNSPNTLDFIYIHLWANAYKNEKTALAKQLYADKEKLLTFGNDSVRGWIDSLDFKINGQSARMEFEQYNIDICKLYLNTPLKPGERMKVSTPFKVKIPSGEISRLGHVGQSYQVTQWYPKPAVYDQKGWHHMPYLNQGEFYSEYGSFDVSVTLPKNYVVGATGDLQTKSELEFLNQLDAQTREKFKNGALDRKKGSSAFPKSDPEFKTIRYTQSKVHDFAWFADKRYEVLKGEVELPHSKRKVTSWAMFTPKNAWVWEKSIEYINDGTYYYSKWNGDYPYNNVTAVDGTISAGGGMEYPNVTVIGNSGSAMGLEIVIVHEVGHNWFYGILGSNERLHGWMDEGMNTLNEVRYVQTKYPDNKELSDMILGGIFHFNDLDHHDSGDFAYRMMAMLGEDQPIETHSAAFTSVNYGVAMYMKTGLVFHYLKDILGDELFDKAMQNYFDTWKFKHPQPEDMRAVLEKTTGKDLSWLFVDLIQTTNHIDYKIKKVKETANGTEITLKNKGQVDGPVRLKMYAGEFSGDLVTEPVKGKMTVSTPVTGITQVVIDENKNIPEMSRSNNTWNKSWLFNKKEPLKFEFLIGDHERNKSNNFWTPVVGGNAHDRFMAGLVLHNMGIPFKRYQYFLAPMYSFGRQSISGIGELSYTFLPKKAIKLTRLGVSVKSFKNYDLPGNQAYFAGVSPYLFLKLGSRKNAGPLSESILFQSIYRYDQFARSKEEYAGGYAAYQLHYKRPNHEVDFGLRIDYLAEVNQGKQLGRTHFETTYRLKYLRNKMNRWIECRTYIGFNWLYKNIPSYDLRYQLSMSGANGQQDLFLEDYFYDRSTNSQRMENMGGFKSTGYYGTNSQWLSSANFYMQLPVKPNIFGVFADFGAFEQNQKAKFMSNVGLGVRLGKVAGLYFPLWMSKDLDASYGDAKYAEKIRFTLKFNPVNKALDLPSLF